MITRRAPNGRQLYLPPNCSMTHIGTIFHQRLADGTLAKERQMTFAPNSGYAFAVGGDTWHSVRLCAGRRLQAALARLGGA